MRDLRQAGGNLGVRSAGVTAVHMSNRSKRLSFTRIERPEKVCRSVAKKSSLPRYWHFFFHRGHLQCVHAGSLCAGLRDEGGMNVALPVSSHEILQDILVTNFRWGRTRHLLTSALHLQ